MPEVENDLVPRDGLTNSHIVLGNIQIVENAAIFRFNIMDEEDDQVGSFSIPVGPQPEGNMDAMAAEAYRKMRDVLRQWVFVTDKYAKIYAAQAKRS